MRYASIRSMDISNGEGVGVSLFVQGCDFYCKNCFNSVAWDFNGGKEWTKEVEEKFIKLIDRPYIHRISILGGEPLHKNHIRTMYLLLKKIKEKYPEKFLWVYTGFTYEEILEKHYDWFNGTQDDDYRYYIVTELCDVLIDGRFEEDKKDLSLKFRGSSNQRVINTKESFKQNKVILYCD